MKHTGSFLETCPHCKEKQDFYGAFQSSDYASEFTFDCSECGKPIETYVHSVPEFEAFKPEDRKPTLTPPAGRR